MNDEIPTDAEADRLYHEYEQSKRDARPEYRIAAALERIAGVLERIDRLARGKEGQGDRS